MNELMDDESISDCVVFCLFLCLQFIKSSTIFFILSSILIFTIGRRIRTLIVFFITCVLRFLKEFSGKLTSSVELDVLTGRIKEAKTLGIGKVETPDNKTKNRKNEDQKEPQPPHVGIDLLHTSFDTVRSHFFRRSLTTRGTGPAARISGGATAAGVGVRVVGALSGTTVRRLITG